MWSRGFITEFTQDICHCSPLWASLTNHCYILKNTDETPLGNRRLETWRNSVALLRIKASLFLSTFSFYFLILFLFHLVNYLLIFLFLSSIIVFYLLLHLLILISLLPFIICIFLHFLNLILPFLVLFLHRLILLSSIFFPLFLHSLLSRVRKG
jgi:hypothetical protein